MKRILSTAARVAVVAALLVPAAFAIWSHAAAAEGALSLPTPAVDTARGQATSAVAILAGGCFWGVQGVFQHVKGVTSAISGYAGGAKSTANYETVSTGATGHAESVQITFDPGQVSYGRLLQIFFSVVHDPTELNRQGPDDGTQYRSAIFPANEEQARIARAYITQLNALHLFRSTIVTKLEAGQTFYRAEDYHQDFLTLNPKYPYIVVNDLPKVEDLKRMFPDRYRAVPVLVSGIPPSR
jgi:peptide-methionine (S)-S-oxide reductase